jgi:polyribonucleotide nucleotidyltransferase
MAYGYAECVLEGRKLSLESGKIAKQADGAVKVQYGDTVVLVTAMVADEVRKDGDFLPLFVEYRENLYAAGKIPGSVFRREGRPTEKEILTSRLIDRPIRPIFPKGFRNEVQIIASVLSTDQKNDPDILAMIGASAALSLCGLSFFNPIGAVRIGYKDEQFILNPDYEQLEKSLLDLVIAGNKEIISTIELDAHQAEENIIIEAFKYGQGFLEEIVNLIKKLTEEVKPEAREIDVFKVGEEVKEKAVQFAGKKTEVLFGVKDKKQRMNIINEVISEVEKSLGDDLDEAKKAEIVAAVEEIFKKEMRKKVLKTKKRIDGRGLEEIRSLSCEVGVLPRTHGSAIFTRGQTQCLSVVTLGTEEDEQRIGLNELRKEEEPKSFILHYNFPPFSVGEIKPVRGPGRREIGHGALAEKALKAVLPKDKSFPYTVRIVSDILESNGSTSMASVCGGTLALMDAGVPIELPVAGISIGLIKEGDDFVLITDIRDVEDFWGDMDFKVTGTNKGVTAIHMDNKIAGIDCNLIEQALDKAKKAREVILESIAQAISKPREEISAYAPRIVTIQVKPDKVRNIIGPGGKNIKEIEKLGVDVSVDDTGRVSVAAVDEEIVNRALDMVKRLVEDPEVGKVYLGKVKRIMDFGAFVEVLPGKEGLVHISQLANYRVKKVEDEVKVGDEIKVKIIEIDKLGRVNLSKKVLEEKTEAPKPS